MRSTWRPHIFLLLITISALFIHGYHPGVEDGEIYLPGIKKILNPDLYPFGSEFFLNHAHLTLFDEIIAASVRITHLSFDLTIFLWYGISVFLTLLACWRLIGECFAEPEARWAGVMLVAALWTIPVAGTALYISDQYLTSRSIVTFAVLFSIWSAWKDRKAQWICWSVVAICVHPLMAVFGISYALLLWWMKQPHRVLSWGPIALLPPNAYRIAVATRPYFFILKWEWYEWLGALAPLVLLWRIGRLAKQHALDALATMSRALVVYGGIFLLSALALTIPDAFQNLALLQPMRSLHLLYILMFLLGGGVLGKWVLKRSAWRWVALFLPLIGLMYTVQRQLFPESPQIEWPGIRVENDWLRAFDWIRQNTPSNALFAIDPEYMIKDDQHGFRAIAERSRLADAIKDSGAVTMFPDQPAAHDWLEQVTALNGWASFREEDFHRLHNDYGVSWAVVQRSLPAKLNCPYQNQTLLVCQVN